MRYMYTPLSTKNYGPFGYLYEGQTTESGIPQPLRASARYSRTHLDF